MPTQDSLPEGTQGEATPESSDTGVIKKGSSGETQYATVAQIQSLNQSIESLRRSLQSGHDKGVKRLEGEVNELKGVLQQYAQSGKSLGDVLQDLDAQEEQEARQAMLEMSRAFREGRFPTSSQGSEQSQGVDVGAVMAELELDETDTRVQAFRAKQFKSPEEAYREGAKLLKQMATRQPSDADAPSTENKRQTLPKDEQERLRQDYESRSKGVYGTALVRLKAQYREKGLMV